MKAPIQVWAREGNGKSLFSLSALIPALADGANECDMQVALERSWKKGPTGKPITLNQAVFDSWVEQFKATEAGEIPVDWEHNSSTKGDTRAAGWIKALFTKMGEKGLELWSRVAWTDKAADAIRAKEFKYCSPTFDLGGINAESGERRGPRLQYVALTNLPFQDGLTAIHMSEVVDGGNAAPDDEQGADDDQGDDDNALKVPPEQNAQDARVATFIDAVVSASGLDRTVALESLLGLADDIGSQLAALADRNGLPAEKTTMKTKEQIAAEEKAKTDAEAKAKADEIEMSTLREQVTSMGAKIATIETSAETLLADAAAQKKAAIETKVDGMIKTGHVRDSWREDAIYMFSNHPERAERLYAEQIVPIGASQGATTGGGVKAAPVADVSKVTVADLTEDEAKIHMACMQSSGGRYDAVLMAQNIIKQRGNASS